MYKKFYAKQQSDCKDKRYACGYISLPMGEKWEADENELALT